MQKKEKKRGEKKSRALSLSSLQLKSNSNRPKKKVIDPFVSSFGQERLPSRAPLPRASRERRDLPHPVTRAAVRMGPQSAAARGCCCFLKLNSSPLALSLFASPPGERAFDCLPLSFGAPSSAVAHSNVCGLELRSVVAERHRRTPGGKGNPASTGGGSELAERD